MSFKDEAARDIERVFINPLEFADNHDINGAIVQCVIDTDVFEENTSRQSGAGEWVDGVFKDHRRIYVKKSLMPTKPVRGEILMLDGDRFYVDKVQDDMGLLTIDITQNDY